jgi:hypothetical protein
MKLLVLISAAIVSFSSWTRGAERTIDFVKDIQPILEKSCIECHGAEKQKGKLRLDTKELAMKGGSEGPVIVPGQADKSDLYRRITLPAGHDDIMPNKGDPLTKAQTDLFRDWINQGAVWPQTAVSKDAKVASTEPKLAPYQPGPAELKAIADLETNGIAVRPIAMNVNWRQANLQLLGSNVTDTTLTPLKNILGLVDLNLGNTKITDAGLANVSNLTNLTRLHLEKTAVTDAGLSHLKALSNLAYLNLYGTSVTDAGVEQLKGLTSLKSLYLWQTKVTEAGVKMLQQALPKLYISTGWDLSVPVKQEEKKEAKDEAKKSS